jgi:hypothetical protein
MKVIATAKIIAVRTRLFERPPEPAVVLALITRYLTSESVRALIPARFPARFASR